jgi:dihydroxyacid dehydratase/phosphogluconate dehydratase
MLYATGLTTDTIKLPQVGICSVWFEGNPCNMHLNDLAADVKIGNRFSCIEKYPVAFPLTTLY